MNEYYTYSIECYINESIANKTDDKFIIQWFHNEVKHIECNIFKFMLSGSRESIISRVHTLFSINKGIYKINLKEESLSLLQDSFYAD